MPTSLDAGKKVVTRFGKSVVIERCKSVSGFSIRIDGGGAQPAEFDGWFSTYPEAELAVKRYMNRNRGKETQKDEAKQLDQTKDAERQAQDMEDAKSPDPKPRDKKPSRRKDSKHGATEQQE